MRFPISLNLKVRQAFWVGSLAIACTSTFSHPVWAGSFGINELYVFGDSNVDLGRVFEASGGTFPSDPPYAGGRFTNGPVWVEYLAQSLGLTVNPDTNFAFGGANTGTLNTVDPSLPGVLTQVNQYVGSTPVADPNGLYIIAAGANDYLFGGLTDPTVAVDNIETSILALAGIGANKIIVSNVFDLGQVPSTQGTGNEATLSSLTVLHQTLLSSRLKQLQTMLGSQVRLFTLDAFTSFNLLQDDPTRFGFTNATEPCLVTDPVVSICSDPNSYFFWDDIHPSTAGQQVFATVAVSSLSSLQSVPESSSVVALLLVSTVALIGRWKTD